MARNQALPGTTSRRVSTQKFLAESRRRRVPPLLWLAAAGTVLFGAFLAWVFLADGRPPGDWWRQEVEPILARMREAEARRDWEAARTVCDEAIAKVQGSGRDFASRIAELKAQRRQLDGEIKREGEADEWVKKYEAQVRAPLPPDPAARYRRALELIREGEDLLRRIAGTRAEARLKASLEPLRAVPPPPPPPKPWHEVKREIDAAIGRDDYAAALRLAREHGGEEGKKIVPLIDSRAGEYFRRRYPRDRTPVEPDPGELREDLRRLEGTAPAKTVRKWISDLTR